MSNSVSLDLLKPLISGGAVVALDMFYLKEQNLNNSLIFGGAVAAGVYVGGMLGQYAPDISLPILGNGKGLEQRIVEIASGAGSAFVLNKYVMKNTSYRDDTMQKLGVIIVADLVGELASDVLAGRPLSVFS